MSKIYLHYDGERGPGHTFIWRQTHGPPSTGRNLGQALEGFVESYSKKHGHGSYDEGEGMDAARLRLMADAPNPFGAGAAAPAAPAAPATATAAIVLDTASNMAVDPALVYPGCDLRVEERAPEDYHPSDTSVAEQASSAKRESAAGAATAGSGGAVAAPAAEGMAVAAVAASAGTKAAGDAAVKAKKLAIKAEKSMARKNLRGARGAVNEALALDPSNGRALRCLADIYVKAGLKEEAFAAAKECCSKASDGGSPEDFLRAGKCLLELQRYEEARTALGRARTAGCGSLVDDADASLAYCRFRMGDAPGAGDMYMEILKRTGEKNVESLVGYGRLAVLFKQVDKGIPSLLRAVMIDQENKDARKVLAGALGMPEGMEALKDQVVPSLQTSSVYSFLGTVTKDHGEIGASVELLRVATTVDPTNASCALGLVHGHEIRGDNAKALAAAKAFLARNPDRGVGTRGLKNSAVLRVLEGVSALSSSPSLSSSSSSPPVFEDLGKAVHWTTLVGGWSPSSSSRIGGGGSGSSSEDDISFVWCDDISPTATAAAAAAAAAAASAAIPSAAASATAKVATGGAAEARQNKEEEAQVAKMNEEQEQEQEQEQEKEEQGEEEERRARKVYSDWLQSGGGGKEMYAAKDLDVLALCFAIVKILYLEGKWSCLPQLLGLVEPARVRSLMPLHKTTIRNEQAYYCCIIQLLSLWGGSNGSGSSGSTRGEEEEGQATTKQEGAPEVVYVCGDSHTLTPAWHEVTVGGRRRVLRPALVTGLKHWHLRPESSFYPKKNFESVVAKVPNGSAVVFILGEIDCREGILVAVDKLRYETAERGVEHTVRIFIKVAEALSKERGLRIFVHPVIPVLDETRGMVKMYNRVLRRMVDKSKHLRWLDFFERLLDDGGAAGDNLHPDYRLDGTHLGPAYVSLLEKALGEAWVEEGGAAAAARKGAAAKGGSVEKK